MARPFADAVTRRIAVLGASSPAGTHLKAALAEQGVPGSRVDLFGGDGDVAILSEYDGEARLVRPAAELDPAAHAAVFVCEGGHDAAPLVAASRAGTLVVDLSGTIAGAALAGVAAAEGGRLVAVPHVVTSLVEPILTPLHARLGLTRASAFVMRPAADLGSPGLEELREQTIHLLRFESPPTDVFGRQLAFNVIPEHLFPAAEESTSARVVAEIRALLEAPDLPVAVTQALLPTFLGHAVALHVGIATGGAAEAQETIRSAAGVRVSEDGEDAGATMDAPEGRDVLVARIEPSGPGGLRIWAVAGDAGLAAGVRAAAVAAAAGIF
jgi:aspartate-semialdehyde dehydrogenase